MVCMCLPVQWPLAIIAKCRDCSQPDCMTFATKLRVNYTQAESLVSQSRSLRGGTD